MSDADQTPVSTRVTRITPGRTRALLASNTFNRPLVKRRVAQYAEDMRRGRWQLNGEPIIVSAQGLLLDGQHRLHAVVESGATVQLLVVRGVAQEAFAGIDTGGKRSAAVMLGLQGERNASTLAAAATLLWQHRHGKPLGGGVHPTRLALSALLQQEPGLRASVELVRAGDGPKRLVSPAVLAFCHHVFSQSDAELADELVEKLRTGAGLAIHSPILVLRNRLVSTRTTRTKALVLRVKGLERVQDRQAPAAADPPPQERGAPRPPGRVTARQGDSVIPHPVQWTNTDYARAVRQLAGTITSDCAGEIVLVVDDVFLYAFARLDSGGRRDDLGVYVSSIDISESHPPWVSHELVAGRKPLAALRDVIDRELASERSEGGA